MTEWPQDRLEKFWRGLGVRKANASYFWGDVCVADQEYDVIKCRWIKGKFKWLNPHAEDKVPLEVLHKGLERLAWEKGYTEVDVCCFRRSGDVVYGVMGKNGAKTVRIGDDRPANMRTAIIAAIELLEVKDGQARNNCQKT